MWFNPKMPDVAPRRPKALSPRALPAPPLVRPLAAALGAINAGMLQSGWSCGFMIPKTYNLSRVNEILVLRPRLGIEQGT